MLWRVSSFPLALAHSVAPPSTQFPQTAAAALRVEVSVVVVVVEFMRIVCLRNDNDDATRLHRLHTKKLFTYTYYVLPIHTYIYDCCSLDI